MPIRDEISYERIEDQAILRLLLAKQKVAILFNELRTFFRDSLNIFIRRGGNGSSGVAFGNSAKPAILSVVLGGISDRFAADLAHELLHLKTAMSQFPVRIPEPEDKIEKHIHQRIIKITNDVQHVIFHDEFVSLGFRTRELVLNADSKGNLKAHKTDLEKCARAGYPYARGDWLALCLSEIISREFGWANQADEAVRLGFESFGYTMADSNWIEDWLKQGAFRTRYHYLGAIKNLLNKFGYPIPEIQRIHGQPGNLEFVDAEQ
jgi:hypothetical protein